jgi:hypothetical protein
MAVSIAALLSPHPAVAAFRAGTLTPKTPSPALYLELLDSLGAPTWMARDVQQLVQLAKAREPAQQLQQRPATAADEQRQPQGASDALSDSDGSGSDAEGSGGEEGEGGQQQQSDDVDVDTLLAMAAAEVCFCVCMAGAEAGRCAAHINATPWRSGGNLHAVWKQVVLPCLCTRPGIQMGRSHLGQCLTTVCISCCMCSARSNGIRTGQEPYEVAAQQPTPSCALPCLFTAGGGAGQSRAKAPQGQKQEQIPQGRQR